MKQLKTLFILPILLLAFTANAQEEVLLPKPIATSNRYVGFNVNPLLSQMLPLSNVQPLNSLYSIMVRRYFDKEIGIRTGFGVVAGDNNQNAFAFQFEFDKRRHLGKNFYYFTGGGAALEIVEDVNSQFGSLEFLFFGVKLHWGIEYLLNNVVSFSTESNLRFGIGKNDVLFKLSPPLNFMAHFNVTRNKK